MCNNAFSEEEDGTDGPAVSATGLLIPSSCSKGHQDVRQRQMVWSSVGGPLRALVVACNGGPSDCGAWVRCQPSHSFKTLRPQAHNFILRGDTGR